MRTNKNDSGFSLVEIIIGVVIVGIGFVGAMNAFTFIRSKSFQIEATFRAVSVANSVMHTVRAENFDESSAEPWTLNLGPEESFVSDFDDADDYAGYAWDFQPKGFPGYDVTTRIYYVNPAVSWVDSVGTQTNYKHIIVQVSHQGLPVPVTLTSLITPKQIVDISDNNPCGTCDQEGTGTGDDHDDHDDHDD
ncbi:MAG: prepilin-type N-terminal cleavage/methylation domain-containing protein [Fidelibacterota bacterium]